MARDIVQTKMNHYFQITDRQWDKKVTKEPDTHPFQPGTMVLVRKMGLTKKLNESYFWGPGIVINTIGRSVVDVQYILNGVIVRQDISQLKLFNLPLDPNDPGKIYYNAPKRGTEGSEKFYVDSNPPTYAESRAEEVYMDSKSLKNENVDLGRSFAAVAKAHDSNTDTVSDNGQNDNTNSTRRTDKNEILIPVPDCDLKNVPDTFSDLPFRQWEADLMAESYLDRTTKSNETIAPCMSVSPPAQADTDNLNIEDDDDFEEVAKKRISFAPHDSVKFIEPHKNNNSSVSNLLPSADKNLVPLRRSARIMEKKST